MHLANCRKWAEALDILVASDSWQQQAQCSSGCLSEAEGEGYHFVDKSRFQLQSSPRYSQHVQCSITQFLTANSAPALHWAPQDYRNFFKAFLRNKALTRAFLKPHHL